MADEEQPSGSIEDRIAHKNWKWRSSGFEELTTKYKNSFESTGALYNDHGHNFKKYLADINPMVQEKVLETLATFIDRCDTVKVFAPSFAPILVEKCFSSTRPKVKDKTIEVLLATIEADSPEAVVDSLLKGTTNSSPKVMTASLIGLREALKTFGPKVIPVKSILKQFQPWFEHRDKAIRDEAMALIVEIYRWMKQALLPLLDSLTALQLKALNETFEKLPNDPAIPLKYMRSEAAKAQAQAAKGIKPEVVEVEEIDPYSMIDAVNILNKITGEFYEGMEAKKWQERQAQIDKLVEILQSSPKIENGDFNELSRTLKKTLADTNVMIVTKAIVAVGLLCEGLRTQYTSQVKQFLVPIMERYKEKKPQVVPAIHVTMEQIITRTLSLPDMVEDLTTMLGSKVAQVKIEVLNFMHKTMSTTKKPQDVVKVAKQLAKVLMDTLNDTDGAVRDGAAKTFAVLANVIGERGMAPYFNQLDAIKLKKIKDLMPTAPAPVAVEAPVAAEEDGKKGAGGKPAARASTGAAAPPPPAISSLEEYAKKLSDVIPSDILSRLDSQNLKDRVEATEAIYEAVSNGARAGMSEPLISYMQEKPGWKEVNFQVTNNHLGIIGALATQDTSFSKTTVSLFLSAVLEKLTDVKLKEKATETLMLVCEALAPEAVFQLAYSAALGNKNPKITESTLVWMAQALEEFGVNSILFKPLFDFIKGCMESSSTPVKTSAIKVLCVLRVAIGPALLDYLSDIKKQLLDATEKEFAKVKDMQPQPQSRQPRVESEVPRTDVGAKFNSILLANLSDNDWKQRQTALEEIERILIDANLKIQPKLGTLMSCIGKGPLTDKNQKVITTSLTLVSLLVTSVGPAIEKSTRTLLPGIVSLLADSKKQLRDAALASMNFLSQELGVDMFVSPIATLLTQESATSRKEGLVWILSNIAAVKTQTDLPQLIKPIITCLQDKNVEIRSNSEQLLAAISASVPGDVIKKEMREVKPTNQTAIQAVIDRYYGKKGAGAAAPAPATAASKLSARAQSPARASTGSRITTPTPSPSVTPRRGSFSSSTTPQKMQPLQPSQPLQPPAASSPSITDEFIINDPNGKSTRQRSTTQSFHFLETDEIQEQLQEQVGATFSEEFANMMFSANSSHQQQVVDMLASVAQEDGNIDLLISVLDIVFRWCSFKLFDVGLTSLKRTLSLLETIAQRMKAVEYFISDYEAGCILPVVTEKMGTTNETFKQTLKQAYKELAEVTQPNSLFKYTLEVTAKTSNWRTRFECISDLGSLINQHGAAVCGNNIKSVISIVAKSLADREPTAKQAAANTLTQLYSHIGDDIWKHIGNISAADRQTLQGMFGSSSVSSPSTAGSSKVPSTQQALQRPPDDEETLKIQEYLNVLTNYTDETFDTVVEYLKHLSNYLANSQSFAEKFLYFSEQYLLNLTNILLSIFPQVTNDQTIFRLCKYLIHTIVTIYSNEFIAKRTSVVALQTVLSESIRLLVGHTAGAAGQNQEDLNWINKALNQVLLRTLQNSNNTTLLSALLQMMTKVSAPNQKQVSPKYKDLLLKCMQRASKPLKEAAQAGSPIEMDVSAILQEVGTLLQYQNGEIDDTFKKAAERLTQDIVTLNQSDVVAFCKRINSAQQASKHTNLFALLANLLGGKQAFDKLVAVKDQQAQPQPKSHKSLGDSAEFLDIAQLGVAPLNTPDILKQDNITIPTLSDISSRSGTSTLEEQRSTVNKEPRNYSAANDDEKRQLAIKIFRKVGSRDETTEGLYDLHYFKKQFPDYDVSPHINRSTGPFQAYIHRSLTKIATEREHARSNVPEPPEVDYMERLREIQRKAHRENSLGESYGDESNQLTATMALNTLNRLRNKYASGQDVTTNNDTMMTLPTAPTTTSTSSSTSLNMTGGRRTTVSGAGIGGAGTGTGGVGGGESTQDLSATVASLRQRLAHIKETSRTST
ncbi:hypothetical protein SAMD00019534_081640 [Acytostelium subglobosum LB1]|uniref:hypothetical protein n=1 Tax=Acytostelium subglobosum LB1 TaxID=1410327 RepID=UPI0006450492|nr:hypothetical protein SAMD00019534_081640 [Acytostelium subglobosum LB1]GAM24989.1 hypothetical protein SAMD00019534_081640 [Acytostelium subglobosum LB1]|eukprot:XP_012752078.1 hypothetical protein SAMD00019534_081640 [Acytostelium subglobosum LB1]